MSAKVLRKIAETTKDPRTAILLFVLLRGTATAEDVHAFLGGERRRNDKYLADLKDDRALVLNTHEGTYRIGALPWEMSSVHRVPAHLTGTLRMPQELTETLAEPPANCEQLAPVPPAVSGTPARTLPAEPPAAAAVPLAVKAAAFPQIESRLLQPAAAGASARAPLGQPRAQPALDRDERAALTARLQSLDAEGVERFELQLLPLFSQPRKALELVKEVERRVRRSDLERIDSPTSYLLRKAQLRGLL